MLWTHRALTSSYYFPALLFSLSPEPDMPILQRDFFCEAKCRIQSSSDGFEGRYSPWLFVSCARISFVI